MSLPVTVLGGYLGVGKTTLLNHVLRSAGGRRLAVLVNDFGELGIDADLIESREAEVLNLSGGCICCSFGSDLVGVLGSLARRLPPPEHVLIEASGVALPQGVGQAVGLVSGLVLDAVIVVVDAWTVRQRAADRYVGDTVTAQLVQADLIVVNKLDLVAAGFRKDLTAWLQRQVPAAPVAHAWQGEVPVELILGSGGSPARGCRVPVRAATRFKTRFAKAPPAEEERAQATGGPHLRRILPPAADRFISITFRFSEPVDLARLAVELADPVLGILRSKGLMRDYDGTPKSFQQVGSRTQTRNLAYRDPDCGRLVCIGLRDSLDEAAIDLRLQAALLPA